jgi:hypothetical protein
MSSILDGLAPIFRDTFGEDLPIPYTHGATTVEIVGIFGTPDILVDGGEIQLVDCDAWVDFAAADLPAGYGENDSVVIRGATYRTKAPQADGQGMVRFPLAKVA